MIRTPGTRITFADLATWCAAAEDLTRRLRLRRGAAARRPQVAHWEALEAELAVAWIRAEAGPATLARFLALLQGDYGPWHRPPRGERGGTKWERLNVETRNQIWRLARAADHAELGLGHNSRNA
jgi:hypothetical protein